MECSWPTIKRILKKMRDELGAPVRYDKKHDGYILDSVQGHATEEQQHELPGLWFTVSELHALLTVHELTTDVGHATDMDDAVRFAESLVSGVAVGLDVALVLAQILSRDGARPGRVVAIDHGRPIWVAATEESSPFSVSSFCSLIVLNTD